MGDILSKHIYIPIKTKTIQSRRIKLLWRETVKNTPRTTLRVEKLKFLSIYLLEIYTDIEGCY